MSQSFPTQAFKRLVILIRKEKLSLYGGNYSSPYHLKINCLCERYVGIRLNLMAKEHVLSFKEMLLLALHSSFKSREIMELLVINESTVRTYDARIKEKLGAKTRLEAFKLAVQKKILKLV